MHRDKNSSRAHNGRGPCALVAVRCGAKQFDLSGDKALNGRHLLSRPSPTPFAYCTSDPEPGGHSFADHPLTAPPSSGQVPVSPTAYPRPATSRLRCCRRACSALGTPLRGNCVCIPVLFPSLREAISSISASLPANAEILTRQQPTRRVAVGNILGPEPRAPRPLTPSRTPLLSRCPLVNNCPATA